MKGKIIVFEGADSSGKTTQLRLFCEHLEKEKIVFEVLKFPRYNEFFGSLVGRHLIGEFGKVSELSPEFCALLYSIDRYQIKKEICEKLASGKILVMDRYVQSNMAHQAAKFSNEKEQEEFLEWIESLESRMPKADMVVFLNMPTETAQKLMSGKDRKSDYRKGSEKDQHETNPEYLERARSVFKLLAEKYNWIVIECVRNNKIRAKQEIQNEIREKLKQMLK